VKEQIRDLLGCGMSASEVAAACGCDPSYVSQLLSDEAFAIEVQALRAEKTAKFIALDEKLDNYEEQALDKMGQLIPFTTRAGEAARIYSVLNGARRRASAASAAAQQPAQTVTINLPAATHVQFVLSSDKQAVEVAGRSLTTMPARSLAARLEARRAQELLDVKVPEALPLSSKIAASL
jgi:transcriptional regulator with XRE-family HTH domain